MLGATALSQSKHTSSPSIQLNPLPTSEAVSGSFRDPSGYLFTYEGQVHRHVSPGFRAAYDAMISSGFYQAAADDGLLIPHDELDPSQIPGHEDAYKVLLPKQINFITYPYEWCFSQLKDAALLTLELQGRALSHDLWLKDASAFNVQFRRGRPIFIDSLSFEPYPEGQAWVGYQQFCKHFLAPLALMATRHIDFAKMMRTHIDGVPLDLAASALPWRTRFSLGLGAHIHMHARSLSKHSGSAESVEKVKQREVGKTALLGLIDNLKQTVEKLEWRPEGTEWGDYYQDTNYSDDSFDRKKVIIGDFLDEVKPAMVWDLGANTGLFSRIAADRNIETVAADIDPAAVEKNYRQVRHNKETSILPLVMDLTNPSASLGWDFDERMSLRDRGPADIVMALALIHHLAISNNVPLSRTARFFAGMGRHLIIEFVPKSDSQVRRLLASREDVFPTYDQDNFERAYAEFFDLRSRVPIEGTDRTLYLFASRASE